MINYVRAAIFIVVLASIGGAFYAGVTLGKATRDSETLRELDSAMTRLFEAESQLDELRKAREVKTHVQIKTIRETVDDCADAVPAPDILRVLDESDESDAARP